MAGEIDIATCARFREALRAALAEGPDSVVVDMSAVEWLDSTGLGALVGALKKAQDRGGTVQVAGVPGRIAKQFQVTGLARLFGMHASVHDALTARPDTMLTTPAQRPH